MSSQFIKIILVESILQYAVLIWQWYKITSRLIEFLKDNAFAEIFPACFMRVIITRKNGGVTRGLNRDEVWSIHLPCPRIRGITPAINLLRVQYPAAHPRMILVLLDPKSSWLFAAMTRKIDEKRGLRKAQTQNRTSKRARTIIRMHVARADLSALHRFKYTLFLSIPPLLISAVAYLTPSRIYLRHATEKILYFLRR